MELAMLLTRARDSHRAGNAPAEDTGLYRSAFAATGFRARAHLNIGCYARWRTEQTCRSRYTVYSRATICPRALKVLISWKGSYMNSIVYIVGLIVAILSFFGLR
jgi:hypothetical protein